MDLNFVVKDQIIKRTDESIIVSKSRNVLFANFKFLGEDWAGKHKFAIFKNGRKAYTSSLGISSDGRCSVPPDALTGKYLRISVFGGDLMTSNELSILLIPSGYTTKISTPEKYGKDIFVEIFEEIESKIDDVIYEDGFLKCMSRGEEVCRTELFFDIEQMVKDEVKENIPYFKMDDECNLYVVYPE